MPAPDPALLFVIKMALRNALKLVRGLRREVGELDEDVMARKLLDEIELSAYRIVKDPGSAGHTFAAPTGPDPHQVIRGAVVAAQELLAAHVHPESKEGRDATIKALLGALDHKDLLAALAATAEATPAAEPPPAV